MHQIQLLHIKFRNKRVFYFYFLQGNKHIEVPALPVVLQ